MERGSKLRSYHFLATSPQKTHLRLSLESCRPPKKPRQTKLMGKQNKTDKTVKCTCLVNELFPRQFRNRHRSPKNIGTIMAKLMEKYKFVSTRQSVPAICDKKKGGGSEPVSNNDTQHSIRKTRISEHTCKISRLKIDSSRINCRNSGGQTMS